MDGFDTIAMSYLAGPMSLPNVTLGLAADFMPGTLLPPDPLDRQSNFDAETFAGSDDATYATHTHYTRPPTLKRYSSTYDDPFSDALSVHEHLVLQEQNGLESPSIDRDNKLLSFSIPSLPYVLVDYAYHRHTISISAQLHGMFFLAESPWAATSDGAAPPTELTCYRRNLFQISGTVTMPRLLRYIMTDQGEHIPILAQELTISATESVEGNAVKIISVPWKTPATNVTVVEDKTEKEPPSIPLDPMNGQDMNSDYVTFPIAWKRLQFRIATANNGRRKELQQHFVVRLKVMATLATGLRLPICEVQSGAIIVRGRSPRNFQSRKDLPISGTGTTARKSSSHIPGQLTRTSTGDSGMNNHVKSERPTTSIEVPQMPFNYDPSDIQVSPDFFEWKIPLGQTGAMTAIPQDAFPVTPAAPYAQSSPDLTRYSQRPPPAPINLSLTDDEPKKPASPSATPKKTPKLTQVPARAPSFSINVLSSPDESADLLYEYFPLGLDDWMPPVDAVYRPHVVHHLSVPADPKGVAVRGRSKRYFSSTEDAP